jgi:uncharacterized membrane protein YdjX (TVP38/TMEM64 family)
MSEGLADARMNAPHGAKQDRGWPVRFLPILLVAAGLGLGYAFGLHDYLTLSFLSESRDKLRALVDAHPVGAPLFFMAAYAAAVAVAFPAASVLTVFGGFLFGWALSSVLVALAATAGATVLFLAARSAFADMLRDRFGPRVAWLADGFERNAFTTMLVLRLAPVLPFFVVNIAPALFRVPVRTYVAATFIGILPGVLAYSWLGQGVESVLAAAEKAGREPALSDLVTWQITLAFVLIALVAAIAPVVKAMRSRNRRG